MEVLELQEISMTLQGQLVRMQIFLVEIVMVYVGFLSHLLKLKVFSYKMKEPSFPR